MASSHSQPLTDIEALGCMLEVSSLMWRNASAAECTDEAPGQWGSWSGIPPRIRLLDDGRTVQLLSPIAYARPDGSNWPVPEGVTLDGASIPQLFWSLIGGPFEGRYRNASIVHDHYCGVQTRAWRDTHRMFYDAMRCSGTPAVQAKILYYAVYRFGPRWAGSGEELVEAPRAAIGIAEARSVVADAEAIQMHDLGLAEIDALADFRNADADRAVEGTEGLELPAGAESAGDEARLLVIPGGSGTADDVAAVAQSAMVLPAKVVAKFRSEGIRIVACRDSVTDFERSLKGVIPRGWEGLGRTWDNVPGTYLNERRRVIIATCAIDGRRAVPPRGSGSHGSCDLVVHESLHGFDYVSGHLVVSDVAFQSARAVDVAKLGPYERQAGRAGLEETYAESGARFVAEPARMEADWPALFEYWSGAAPIVEESVDGAADAEPQAASIGTLTLAADGRLDLELRAEGPGAVGHASIRLGPEDPGFAQLRPLVGEEAVGAAAEPVLLPAMRAKLGPLP